MILHPDIVQGTDAWRRIRAGIPTASNFDQIAYSKLDSEGKLPASKSAEKYMMKLLAERVTGEPEDGYVSDDMKRGLELELEAVGWYEFERGVDTRPVGFITNDEGTIGCSPDRLADEDGGVEIKCPKGSNHLGYLLGDGAAPDYWQQVQGTLWLTGRKWWDVLSYHPKMPASLVRVQRDEAYIAKLAERVRAFSARLEERAAELIERGWIKGVEVPRKTLLEVRLAASLRDPYPLVNSVDGRINVVPDEKDVAGATPAAVSTEGAFESRQARGVQAQPKHGQGRDGLPEEPPIFTDKEASS